MSRFTPDGFIQMLGVKMDPCMATSDWGCMPKDWPPVQGRAWALFIQSRPQGSNVSVFDSTLSIVTKQHTKKGRRKISLAPRHCQPFECWRIIFFKDIQIRGFKGKDFYLRRVAIEDFHDRTTIGAGNWGTFRDTLTFRFDEVEPATQPVCQG